MEVIVAQQFVGHLRALDGQADVVIVGDAYATMLT